MVSSGVLGFCQPCVGRSKQTPRVNGTNQGGAGQKSPDWRQIGEWIATRQFLGDVWVNERGSRLLRPLTPRRAWLRALDLNQRPLGYEETPGSRATQTETNDGVDLRDDAVGTR